jgi:hypothetical protein
MSLLVFNWVGYKLLVNYLEKKADHQLESRIDVNDYDESQLLEIRVSLNLPYQNTWTEFERCYGEIEIDGNYYTYVKRKIEQDALVLKCIANRKKQTIKNTGNILFKAINGIDQEQNGKSQLPVTSLIKTLFSDFDDHCLNYHLDVLNGGNRCWINSNNLFVNDFNLPVCEQPPERSALC